MDDTSKVRRGGGDEVAAAPFGERTIEVHSFDLTEAEQEALFDRVAEAAHALDEQVTCFGSLA